MAIVLKPPMALFWPLGSPSVFLAGSIEMGVAAPWQSAFEERLDDLEVTVLNPRREAWDSSWTQDISNTDFREQVEWELEAQERATVIVMHFDPATKAPITLLELGLFAQSGRLVVHCPEGYWRLGNVQVVCARYSVPMVSSFEGLVAAARERL